MMIDKKKIVTAEQHYDLLVKEGNDPIYDPPKLKKYMDRYDGETFFEQLGDTTGRCILEIGIGTGRLATKVLKLRPKLLVGIDISGSALEKCRKNTENAENLILEKATFPNWQTAHVFNLIYSSQTFMHIKDLYNSMITIGSLLSRDGRAVISFANCEPLLDFGNRAIRLYKHNPKEIQAIADRCGFNSRIQELTDGYETVAWLWMGEKAVG